MVENLPNSVLEAMACGVPAVAYDTGGMKDAVRHMDTAYLARHADAKDLVQWIIQLLKDDHLRKRMGERAQRLVAKEFEKMRAAKSFLDPYQEKCGFDRDDAA